MVEVNESMVESEEKFEESMIEKWAKEKSRLEQLISVLCSQIRDNLNQEDGTLCLAFVHHILNKTEHSIEILEKIWFELHMLLNQSLRLKSALEQQSLVSTTSSNGDNKSDNYEVISTDTSVDSIETQSDLIIDILAKETNPVKQRINETINRHLIL